MDEQGWAAPDTTTGGERPPGFPTAPPAPVERAPSAVRTAPRLPVPLRPMSLTDLLDGAFAVIKARPRTVFTIAAAILIPTHVVAAFLQRHTSSAASLTNTFNLLNAGSTGSSGRSTLDNTDILWAYVAAALLALSLFFLGGALGRLVTAWYAGSDLTAGEALSASFRRTPALVGAFLLLLVPKLVGFCICYVPGVLAVTLFALTAPALVVEGLGPIGAAQRSWRLVASRFWPCVGIIVLATLGAQLLTAVMGIIPTLVASALPSPLDWIATAAVSSAVAMIVITALVSLSVLLYIDLRIRTEGLDIELGAADAFRRAR